MVEQVRGWYKGGTVEKGSYKKLFGRSAGHNPGWLGAISYMNKVVGRTGRWENSDNLRICGALKLGLRAVVNWISPGFFYFSLIITVV